MATFDRHRFAIQLAGNRALHDLKRVRIVTYRLGRSPVDVEFTVIRSSQSQGVEAIEIGVRQMLRWRTCPADCLQFVEAPPRVLSPDKDIPISHLATRHQFRPSHSKGRPLYQAERQAGLLQLSNSGQQFGQAHRIRCPRVPGLACDPRPTRVVDATSLEVFKQIGHEATLTRTQVGRGRVWPPCCKGFLRSLARTETGF